jgi:3-oxoacyl-[acyl-carrier-protein] synthase III
MHSGQLPINIAAYGLSLPTTSRSVSRVFELEADRVAAQLAALSAPFRDRLMAQLGLTDIAREETSCSRQRGRHAAEQALVRAGANPRHIGYIIDYSTYAVDTPILWSLGHDIQNHIHASSALVVGTRGSGCCGLHLAFRTAQAFLQSAPSSCIALLVASDRAPDTGRVCLPVSIMSDAASALVVTRVDSSLSPIACVRGVALQCSGRYVDLLTSTSAPSAISIDAAQFEQHLAPLHFIALNRVLSRSLQASRVSRDTLSALVYPNTTLLDRLSACRALNFDPGLLVGPGPSKLGHAFANDLVINAQCLLERQPMGNQSYSAWLAAGSGFTWGAAIVEN